jgi:hypothetical protein
MAVPDGDDYDVKLDVGAFADGAGWPSAGEAKKGTC